MSFFNQLFFNIFNHLKKGRYKKSANDIAMFYITLVQGSFLLVLGIFFAEFLNQMNVITIASTKAWSLFGIVLFILYFKNWMQYSGKKRKVLNAQQRKNTSYSVWVLCLIPITCIFISILLMKIF